MDCESRMFRAALKKTLVADDSIFVWSEGPYPGPERAQERIDFWKDVYADSGRWRFTGHVEVAEVSWRPL